MGTQHLSPSDRTKLITWFSDEGFDRLFLETVFMNNRLKKIPVVVSRNVNNAENKDNYRQFLSPYSIQLAKRFSRRWRTMLKRASLQFEVDKEVIVAILLVETGFGNVLGKYPVISVFASILLENEDHMRRCRQKSVGDCENLRLNERLQKKADWAKQELKALLTIVKDTGHSPYRFKGSYAGAFGIPQFLPSSYLKWGYDSDQNGSVNLFLFPDTIYSIANYLKSHGWQKGLERESNKDVIWMYNHSQTYVETVYSVAMKIREPEQKPVKTQKRPSLKEYADGSQPKKGDES